MHGILVVTTCGTKEVDFMNTETTKERLTEWFYPTEKEAVKAIRQAASYNN